MIFVWYPNSDVIIAAGINSQPNGADNHAHRRPQGITRHGRAEVRRKHES